MALPAGRRSTRIGIGRRTTLKNGLNEDIETWSTIATRWAEKLDVSDGERVRAAEVGAILTCRFRVLRDSVTRTLTPKDRIVVEDALAGERTYDIFGIKEIGRAGFEISAAARADLEDAA